MSSSVKPPQRLASYFTDDKSRLASLCQHIEFLANLEMKLRPHLPQNLQDHFHIANYSNNTLILHADSAVWATRLRYCTPQILQFMQTECKLFNLKTIRIKVKLPEPEPVQKPRGVTTRSASTPDLIRQVANSVTDEDLRNSLHNIAKHYHDV